MAAVHPHALQDTFLDHVRKHDVPVTIFLANGIRLQGIMAGFDSYSLLLVRDRHSQLIYKHAISTIVPSEPDRMAQVSDRQETSQSPAEKKVSNFKMLFLTSLVWKLQSWQASEPSAFT